MRVIAGKLKSRRLKTVDSHLTRPTTDKNKENLFNMIGPYFEGGICLDLFAGSGGLGIEAISRGMDKLYSVDKQYKAYQVIQDNVKTLGIEECVCIYKMDYWKALQQFAQTGIKFDLVFLDPPYRMKAHLKILEFLNENHLLNPNCIIVIEDLHEEIIEVHQPFFLKKQQSYGITTLQIIEYGEECHD
jgi:RNA methyltransferase, RsmD family